MSSNAHKNNPAKNPSGRVGSGPKNPAEANGTIPAFWAKHFSDCETECDLSQTAGKLASDKA